jgi:O-antigen/teichoic acid export membrane protein
LRWQPVFTNNFSFIYKNFSFCIKLLGSRIAEALSGNVIQLIIGKIYTIDDVGYYTKALSIQGIPNNILTTTVNEVSYPALARSDKNSQMIIFKRMIRGASMISFPLAVGLIVVAKPLILLLLTEKWARSIPIMQVLSLMISIMSLSYLNNSMLKLHGKVGFILWTSIFKNVLIISLLLFFMRQGVMILCYVYVGVNILIYLLYAFNSGKVTEYRLLTQIYDILPFIICALVMGGAMYLCNFIIDKSLLMLLSLQCVTGLIVIISIYFFFFRNELYEFLYMFKRK